MDHYQIVVDETELAELKKLLTDQKTPLADRILDGTGYFRLDPE